MNTSDRVATLALAVSVLSLATSVYVVHDAQIQKQMEDANNVVIYEGDSVREVGDKSISEFYVDNFADHKIEGIWLAWPGGAGKPRLILYQAILPPCTRLDVVAALKQSPIWLNGVHGKVDLSDAQVYFHDEQDQWWSYDNMSRGTPRKSEWKAHVEPLQEAFEKGVSEAVTGSASPLPGCRR